MYNVRPTIEYATPIWTLTLTTPQLAMFDVLQAKVCRQLLGSAKIKFDRYESNNSLNSMCNLESLHFRRTLHADILWWYWDHDKGYSNVYSKLPVFFMRLSNRVTIRQYKAH